MLAGVGRLKEVAQTNNRDFLWSQIPKSGDTGLAVSIAASRRLDEFPWPMDPKIHFDQLLFVQDKILKRVKRVEDTQRRMFLDRDARQRGRQRWRMYVDGAQTPRDLERALAKIGLFDVEHESLDPQMRFNLLLYGLKRTDPQISEARLLEVARQFQQRVAQLGEALNQKRSVATLLTGLAELTSQEPSDEPAPLSAKKMGPSTSVIADVIPWEVVVEEDGARILYTWSRQAEATHTLEFIRIDASETTGPAFYLCKTEVPIGLFLDVVTEADRWPQFVKLMRTYPRGELHAPKGPFVWKWRGQGRPTQAAKLSDRWLLGIFGKEDYVYPDALLNVQGQPESLGRDHPIQQVSATAAIYFARLLGCRLPTSQEWQSAHHTASQSRAQLPSNLRDERWLTQKEHIVDLVANGKSIIDWPDSGIFWPADIPESQLARQRDAVAVTSENDGYLWFSPVDMGSGSLFRNLVGNVAEFVFDSPKEMEQLEPLSPAGVETLLANHAKDLKVIGASALSPPDVEIDQAYHVKLSEAKLGFSDVGLRLAFSLPDESLHEKFKRLVSSTGYEMEPD